METQTTLEANLSLSVNYNGVSPIGGGRMSFSPNHLKRVTSEGGNTFVKRILFADLITDGSQKKFKMLFQSAGVTDHSGVTLTNPAGENIIFVDTGTFFYLKPNVNVNVVSDFFGFYVDANGALMLDYNFVMDEPAAGGAFLTLTWNTSAITAIGNANFYCDLILAFY